MSFLLFELPKSFKFLILIKLAIILKVLISQSCYNFDRTLIKALVTDKVVKGNESWGPQESESRNRASKREQRATHSGDKTGQSKCVSTSGESLNSLDFGLSQAGIITAQANRRKH
jgi:hypothetical protein